MALSVASAAFVALLAISPAPAAELELRLATINPPGIGYGIPAQRFAQQVHELSNGRIEISVYYSGVLGNLQQLLGQMRADVLDLAVIEIYSISILDGARSFSVFSAPYLFRDQEHLRQYLASDLFRQMMAPAEQETRIKYVGYVGDRAPRALTTRARPVRSPDDLRGLKIRVPLEPVMAAVWREWGANPTSVKASDMYMALQTAMVDGQENGIITVAGVGLFAVQHFYSPIDYVRSGMAVYMSGEKWNSLTGIQRKWLQKAAARVDEESRAGYESDIRLAYAKGISAGVTIVDVDRAAFEEASRKIIERFSGKRWPAGLYEKIQEIGRAASDREQ
jgi:TRAP-type C4-dicarboxylate transport system substrate-binding protein